MSDGAWYLGENYPIYQLAHDPSTGGAIDADSLPTFRIYEEVNGTALVSETMALHDSGNTIGFYSALQPLLATTGFEVGKGYVVYKQVVVGGVTDTEKETFKVIDVLATSGITVSVGDPWTTALPGSYGAGTAGKILGDLPTSVSSVISSLATMLLRIPSVLTISGGKVTPVDSEDGVPFAKWMKNAMAVILGKTIVSLGGNQVEFKDRNNNIVVTITHTGNDGERSGSSIT